MKSLNDLRALPTRLFAAALLLAIATRALADVHYVGANSTNPTPPYTSWATAAATIQDAVDVATAGDEIVVSNGMYATGGRAVDGTMTNRVAVDKPLTLRSVNGPQWTIIQGYQVPGTTNGDGAIRCVYLANGSSLSGFTLTNGATRAVNDYPTNRESFGGAVWCESTNAVVVSNCILAGNSAYGDGGSYQGTLHNCQLSGNSSGSAAVRGVLNNCVLSGNLSDGAHSCLLNHCTVTANSGSGAVLSTLNNCTLTANLGLIAADECTLSNCALSDNFGLGARGSTLNNCTLTGNSGRFSVPATGGAAECRLNNCIVYFNKPSNYDTNCTLNYCCTTPPPTNSVGNISLDPQLANSWHVSAGSPCRGAGSAAYASGMDIDGEPWGAPPSIGCDEYQAGALTGPLQVGITASWTNVPLGFAVQLTGRIDGRPATSAWDFGDGIGATNEPYTAHAWAATGDYAVVLRAVNESQPDGISATVTVHVVTQPVLYVAAESARPLAPYSSWATAATNIQDAVDAVAVPGSLVLVTNGIYGSGGRGTAQAQVVVDKLLTLRSVNGAAVTTIDGGNSNRCVYLADGTSLSGFTLANGFVFYGTGGGLYCEATNAIVSNCVLAGNSVGGLGLGPIGGLGGGVAGGGAYRGTLNNCVLSGNHAYPVQLLCGLPPHPCWSAASGGGAYESTLNNCTLTDNSPSEGEGYFGGAFACVLNNCISFSKYAGSTCEDCKAPGHFVSGNNWAGDPLFVDPASGNLRLQSNSPCINAGLNAFAPPGPDLDGNPRIMGGTVDLGAYEFQSPTSLISYAWLQQYNLATDGSADFADSDGDGLNNWQEWRCGTDPTNALSALRLLAPVADGTNVTVTWQSVAGVNYFLERSTNLVANGAFRSVATNILGQPGTTSYTETNTAGNGPWFYRVGVGN
jgi:hypothetical protein